AGNTPIDDENDVADTPRQVSGAFLACATMFRPGAQLDGDRVYGCRVEKDGAKVDLKANTAQWRASVAGVKVQALAADAPYHVEAIVPKAVTDSVKVFADVAWASGFSETLEAPLGVRAPQLSYRLGVDHDFHV